jgi:DNA-binding CsgD family transcriptional regulator
MKVLDIIYNKQKVIEFSVLFLALSSISFSIGNDGTKWFWSDYPFIALLLVIIALSLAIVLIRIEKKKVQDLSNKISLSSNNNSNLFIDRLNLLTNRQREIFDLISEGKSNKEIINKLFIELSTLKTHINKIYKTLEISNRKEARAISRNSKTN